MASHRTRTPRSTPVTTSGWTSERTQSTVADVLRGSSPRSDGSLWRPAPLWAVRIDGSRFSTTFASHLVAQAAVLRTRRRQMPT